MQAFILNEWLISDRFILVYDNKSVLNDTLQSKLCENVKFSPATVDFVINAVAFIFNLDVTELQLPALKIPVATKESGVFL